MFTAAERQGSHVRLSCRVDADVAVVAVCPVLGIRHQPVEPEPPPPPPAAERHRTARPLDTPRP